MKSTKDFIHQMLVYCGLSRLHTPEEALKEDGCILRERHMAFRIQEALASGKRVLAVTGGFHSSGILELLKNGISEDKPRSMGKDDQEVYPMVYSMEAADALNGYASGMQSPDFYDRVWKHLQSAESKSDAYEETVLSYLIEIGKKARKQDEPVSSYDEICAYSMAKGLAALRGKSEPGIYELRDSVLSSYIKGEVTLSTEAPLLILRTLTTGNRVGKLCESAPRPPLLTNFEETCLAFGLNLHSASEQEILLEIFSKEKHLRLSRFFYELDFLNIGFARRAKGADLLNRRDKSRIREIWRYKWTSQVTANLIDISIHGGSVEEAAKALLLERFSKERSCETAAKLLVQSFQMGFLKNTADFRMNLRKFSLLTETFLLKPRLFPPHYALGASHTLPC